ncbi:MAG TPA: hypothetical protein VFV99_14185 [Kofleriaceae bacterium]|nr:hypothetical protein [Kofleriaceae bacterium]
MGQAALVALLALAACNQVYGLEATAVLDAPYRVDGPPDAPQRCPPLGTPLRATGVLNQVVRQNCFTYTASAGSQIAVATCEVLDEMGNKYVASEGRLDDSMAPIDLAAPIGTTIDQAHISPEGDEIYVRATTAMVGAVVVYRRQADGKWTFGEQLPIAQTASFNIGGVTRRPHRHLLLLAGSAFYEYVSDDAGNWPETKQYTFAQLDVTLAQTPTISSDGLRILFSGYSSIVGAMFQTRYAERAGIDDNFMGSQPVMNMPSAPDPFLIDDCSRIYFSSASLQSVFAADLAY